MALKSEFTLAGALLTYVCSEIDEQKQVTASFSRDIDLAAVFGLNGANPLQSAAIAFAARTALRNSTGGRDIEEAEAAVDARIAAWTSTTPEWGAERGGSESSGAPFTPGHILAKAVARTYAAKFPDAAAAAAELSSMLESALSSAGHPSFAELDEENQRKARNNFVKTCREKDARVELAISEIQAEAQAKRLQAAKAKAGDSGAPGLF